MRWQENFRMLVDIKSDSKPTMIKIDCMTKVSSPADCPLTILTVESPCCAIQLRNHANINLGFEMLRRFQQSPTESTADRSCIPAASKLRTLQNSKRRPTSCRDVKLLQSAHNSQHAFQGVKIFLRSFFFLGCFFVFQFGAVFLAICCILEPKSLICMLFAAFWT